MLLSVTRMDLNIKWISNDIQLLINAAKVVVSQTLRLRCDSVCKYTHLCAFGIYPFVKIIE